MLNKRRYSSEIAVFDTTALVEATVNETLCYFLPLRDYRSLQ